MYISSKPVPKVLQSISNNDSSINNINSLIEGFLIKLYLSNYDDMNFYFNIIEPVFNSKIQKSLSRETIQQVIFKTKTLFLSYNNVVDDTILNNHHNIQKKNKQGYKFYKYSGTSNITLILNGPSNITYPLIILASLLKSKYSIIIPITKPKKQYRSNKNVISILINNFSHKSGNLSKSEIINYNLSKNSINMKFINNIGDNIIKLSLSLATRYNKELDLNTIEIISTQNNLSVMKLLSEIL